MKQSIDELTKLIPAWILLPLHGTAVLILPARRCGIVSNYLYCVLRDRDPYISSKKMWAAYKLMPYLSNRCMKLFLLKETI
jgi:hypothetical protein